ncbi:MAG: response regulator [Ruminococcaceae bacterium]|nr:response regulator [Oscillospiraceae bacterium]
MDTAKKVMFVSAKQSLITDALLNKIRTWGAEPFYVLSAQQLAESGEDADSVVCYLEGDAAACAPLHAALDAWCAKCGAEAVCVGSREQYEAFLRSFAPERVAEFFERPLNMERFLSCVVGKRDAAARRARVLVVDDDASYRQFVREWLRDICDVSMANGGEQALKLLSAQKPDLILLDYEMPDLSGPQTLEKLRALPQAEKIPVIFLTGNEDASSARQVLSLHPAGYLRKSVGKEELLAKVGEALAGV